MKTYLRERERVATDKSKLTCVPVKSTSRGGEFMDHTDGDEEGRKGETKGDVRPREENAKGR